MHKEPQIPLVPTLFFEDTTQEAIAAHISDGWPSASIWSDEAAIVFNGHGMQANTTKFISLLNRLWDGKDFITHRKTSKSFTISNRRLTVSLMLQPLLMQQMIEKTRVLFVKVVLWRVILLLTQKIPWVRDFMKNQQIPWSLCRSFTIE